MLGRHPVIIPEFEGAPVESTSVLRWVWFFLRPYKWLFTGLTLNHTCRQIFFMGVQPLLIAKMISGFEDGSAMADPSIVWRLVGWFVGISIVVHLLLLVRIEEAKLYDRIGRNARLLGLAHLNRLSAHWHEQADSGGKLQKIMTGSLGLRRLVRLYFLELIQFSMGFVGTAVAIWGMGLPLFYLWVFAGMMLTYVGFAWWTSIFVSRGYNDVNVLLEKLVGKVYEFVNATLTVKIFNLGEHILNHAREGEQEGYAKSSQVAALDYCRWIGLNLIGLFWVVLVFFLAANQTLAGEIKVAAFALLAYQAMNMWGLLENFTSVYSQMVEEASAFKRLVELLRQPVTITDDKRKTLKVEVGEITFNKVSFTYNGEKLVFDGLELKIKAGEHVGIVGTSGSGKSTLVKLLLRFYDAEGNGITIDRQNIRKVSQDSLRQNIAVIPQDISLFNHSVLDNIRYGRLNASDAEVIQAAKLAHADEFIRELPEGYDTIVGERGTKLSGGQRQRIAIARAMLKDAPILILDEATSALDMESECLIQQSLEGLMRQKTVIAIAHRLSTIQHLDRLIVFDQGKIVEEGSHDALLKQNGTYARLWKIQSGEFY